MVVGEGVRFARLIQRNGVSKSSVFRSTWPSATNARFAVEQTAPSGHSGCQKLVAAAGRAERREQKATRERYERSVRRTGIGLPVNGARENRAATPDYAGS